MLLLVRLLEEVPQLLQVAWDCSVRSLRTRPLQRPLQHLALKQLVVAVSFVTIEDCSRTND